MKRLSVEAAHGLFDIGNLAKIEKSKNKGIENGKHMRRCPLTNLTGIFGKSPITTVMEAIFNGIITNDKFCLSRMKQLPKMSARKDFPKEVQSSSEAIEETDCLRRRKP
ncbi:MAG TPA: hypothetical protein VKY19_15420 [Ktedonosporobacter sp.]|nr:hypothetical protein [Ktedonosporobacter sp.]